MRNIQIKMRNIKLIFFVKLFFYYKMDFVKAELFRSIEIYGTSTKFEV